MLVRRKQAVVTLAAFVGVVTAAVTASAAPPGQVSPRAKGSGAHSQERMPSTAQSYRVWRGSERGLPDHTILRPADLRQVPYRVPIVVWANGGCRKSNEEYRYFLTKLASTGVMVVANGAPGNPFELADLEGVAHPEPQQLIESIDWALQQNASRASQYFGRLDVRRVLVMGQSCGGWEAVDASKDPRVKATIVWNSGMNPYHPSGVQEMHAPLLVAYGGTTDHVAWDAEVTYALSSVPSVKISHPDGGHTNWWDGSPSTPTEQMKVPLPIALNWMSFTLYNTSAGRKFFLGDACGLCRQPDWSVESKNWGTP